MSSRGRQQRPLYASRILKAIIVRRLSVKLNVSYIDLRKERGAHHMWMDKVIFARKRGEYPQRVPQRLTVRAFVKPNPSLV